MTPAGSSKKNRVESARALNVIRREPWSHIDARNIASGCAKVWGAMTVGGFGTGFLAGAAAAGTAAAARRKRPMIAVNLIRRLYARGMQLIVDGPADATRTFIFAHGAGGPMDSAFMATVAQAIAATGLRVVRFEFPYMAARRAGKRSGAPDREPVLLETWREVVKSQRAFGSIAIGGKSMGGRMASMVADELGVVALVCFGYPFHPPGQPQKLRTAHLAALQTPTLILQGERDPFGGEGEVAGYRLSPSIRVEWVPDGDHSFKPRARSGQTESGNVQSAAETAAAFIRSR